jgi:hypothetical protein
MLVLHTYLEMPGAVQTMYVQIMRYATLYALHIYVLELCWVVFNARTVGVMMRFGICDSWVHMQRMS